MNAPVTIPFEDSDDREREAPRVADHLRNQGLVAYPTETVYGFGCALLPRALEQLVALKQRVKRKPFLMLVAGPEHIDGVKWSPAGRALASAFWPGPLTIIESTEPDRFPLQVLGGGGTVALRASPHPAASALLKALGGPITSTSANPPGEPPAGRAEEAAAALRALGAGEDVWLLDGGALPPSRPSTIVDCSVSPPRIVRPGALPTDELRTVVREIDD